MPTKDETHAAEATGERKKSRGRPSTKGDEKSQSPKKDRSSSAKPRKSNKNDKSHLEETKEAPKVKAKKEKTTSISPEKQDKKEKKSKPAASSSSTFVPQPFGASSAYTIFVTDFVKEWNEKHPDRKKEAFAEGGKKWKTLDDKARAPYLKKAEQDKERHAKQLAELEKKGYFKLEDGSKSTDEKNAPLFKKQVKSIEKKETKAAEKLERKSESKAKGKKGDKSVAEDEDDKPEQLKPKRPMNAYFQFSNEYRKTLLEKNSDLSIGETSKLVKEKWDGMSEKQKEPYEKKTEEDKKRYQSQLNEIEKKGYFMLPDGSKSTDEKNIPKPKRKSKKDKSMMAKSHLAADDDEIATKKPRKNAKDHAPEIEKAREAHEQKKKQK